ncbi:hypothetical protein GF407_00285 [candidate division KSB1 bacterium]|nr:hypothetical protein [candidate division KSB1 bacterium]
MQIEFNKNILNQTLQLLGNILDRDEQADFIHIIVSGGSSLIMLGLVSRTTRDMDIIAYLSNEKNNSNPLQYAKTLPEFLMNAASQVAADLGLDEKWLNTGPKDLLQFGLPCGFLERLHTQSYGKKLTVSFVDRIDQIHFKTYAAVDSGPGRHVDDLLALNPSGREMEQAAIWVLHQDPSPEFKSLLIKMLKVLHYESVAEKL